jgi:hypothetical protein
MLTEIERYLFDVNGYMIVPDALSPEQVAAINRLMEEKIESHENPKAESISFPNVLSWRGPMVELIDNPRVVPYLEELCGPNFRLDHNYAFTIRPGYKDGGAYILHGGAIPFEPNHHYGVHEGKLYGAEVAVVYQLNDVREGDGGFGCVPGTHRSNFKIPEAFRDLRKPQPAVKNLSGPAGSAIIFTETLAHGTLPWNGKRDRRAVFYKYTPNCIGLSELFLDEFACKWPELTRRQREILEAPNVRSKDRKRLQAYA